ncbi:ADP-ribosylation factor GTPase-activating protein AGD2-like isoform X2 [Andrographis paniculata]|uniref:ADP-ribosylation factor GTPase-activating protein AGD2-like isoform X2 n=1 Tax=Andrographis paniculata TaxID=175694 RepID=UPI0021E7FD63|nr:ADP-ribosylation factor GTPase-activating protein AGD2-like isoform X2 [Andrographis paniculata]
MSAAFSTLEDSPMFQKQVRSLEQTADDLRDRCQKLCKSCKKYTEVLGEACNGDKVFVASLEAFGGGLDDLLGVSIGGPVLSKFINVLNELVTYKEFLRSQVEHVLVDRLSQFLSVDLQEAKESRRRFDKAIYAYDQAREKFASLKKTTREDIVAELEEDLHNSKSAFEKSRFNLVLTFAQQSKEQANIEQDKLAKRIQEYRTQSQLTQLQASNRLEASSNAIALKGYGMNAYKTMEDIMLATAKGEVQTIKQGYLLKRSTSLRADWKRRFFVLDSHGTLYYYRDKGSKPMGSTFQSSHSVEHNHRVFGRFRSRLHREASLGGEDNLGCSTVDLRTSTIKIDAEDTDLRLCFRIISPLKTYTLQAETEADRIDWMNKITGVITSLLNSHLHQLDFGKSDSDRNYDSHGASLRRPLDYNESSTDDIRVRPESVSKILREVPGNDQCAECCAPDPDWASLNLGVLMCIECSGIHRNLGVHISKVRSLNLDVRVWEPVVLDLFRALGNSYCNSVWEELLLLNKDSKIEFDGSSIAKPSPKDGIHEKEKFIQAKYARKLLVNKEATALRDESISTIWKAVRSNNLQEVYRIVVTSDANLVNSTYDGISNCSLCDIERESQQNVNDDQEEKLDQTSCETGRSSCDPGKCLRGCSLLHLACQKGDMVMLELLLQLGADINKRDFHGRTPLQHCILKENNEIAKFLLRRGAWASIRDAGGLTALERAMEMGAITDEELFILLSES